MLGIGRAYDRFRVAVSSCALLAISMGAGAELLPIRVYRQQDGLAHQNVRSILQDVRGFLWMGIALAFCGWLLIRAWDEA